MIDDNCSDHQTDLDQVVQKDFELADVVRGKRAGWYIFFKLHTHMSLLMLFFAKKTISIIFNS